jgi:Rieske Fe-S protein
VNQEQTAAAVAAATTATDSAPTAIDSTAGHAPTVTRRIVLVAGVATGAAGALALAGCSKSSSSSGDASAATAGGNSTAGSRGGAAGQAAVLAKVADVPVGNALSATMNGQPILISQPTAGTIVTFSAICTHQGCTVAPAGKEFHCPCHGSVYNAATGAVIQGPAPAPLKKIATHVADGEVIAGA